MNSKNFAKNLKAVIEFIEMSQAELSNKTGLTQAAISQILSGKRDPSLSTICKILKVLPVNFERLTK